MAISSLLIAAVNCILLTKVVFRTAPFHSTTEFAAKFAPLTVSVNPAATGTALLDESDRNSGNA